MLLICLSLATEITAIVSLSLHQEPDSSNASLIVSASALVLMIAIWLPKRYLARALDSSAMAGEATCSLSCIQITIVLFVGSLIFRLWSGGWWVDSATSLILGLIFCWEGYKLIKWVRDPDFDGGCCKKCHSVDDAQELGESYRDLCDCCVEKTECKDAGECKCGGSVGEEVRLSVYRCYLWHSEANFCHLEAPDVCCSPQSMDGSKCCTHQIINGTRPERVSTFFVSSPTLFVSYVRSVTQMPLLSLTLIKSHAMTLLRAHQSWPACSLALLAARASPAVTNISQMIVPREILVRMKPPTRLLHPFRSPVVPLNS